MVAGFNSATSPKLPDNHDRQAKIRVSKDLLISLLKLPSTTEIIGISDDTYMNSVDILVRMNHLEHIKNGEPIPTIVPEYRKTKMSIALLSSTHEFSSVIESCEIVGWSKP